MTSNHENQNQSVTQESEFSPEREKRVFDILSAMGNDERKALLLIAMPEGVAQSRTQLHRRVLELQGDYPVWHPYPVSIFSFCQDSLEPIGLVAKAIPGNEQVSRLYVKTELGLNEGEAIAGAVLKYSESPNSVALQKLLGRTSKREEHKNRSPRNTLLLIAELLTNPNSGVSMSLIDEAADTSAVDTIQRLDRAGLLEYIATAPGQAYITYRRGSNFESRINHRVSVSPLPELVSDAVRMILEREESLDSDLLLSQLTDKVQPKSSEEKDALNYAVQTTLQRLSKKGIIQVAGVLSSHKKSSITLKPVYAPALASLIDDVYSVINKDEQNTAELRRYAHQVANQPERVKLLFARGLEASPFTNRRSRAELGRKVLTIIESGGHPISIKQLALELENQHSIILTKKSVGQIAKHLHKNGKVEVEVNKKQTYYRPLEEQT